MFRRRTTGVAPIACRTDSETTLMRETLLGERDDFHRRPRGTLHYRDRNRLVKGDKAAATLDRQPEEVQVGQLAVAVKQREVEQGVVVHRHRVGPELVPLVAAEAAEM